VRHEDQVAKVSVFSFFISSFSSSFPGAGDGTNNIRDDFKRRRLKYRWWSTRSMGNLRWRHSLPLFFPFFFFPLPGETFGSRADAKNIQVYETNLTRWMPVLFFLPSPLSPFLPKLCAQLGFITSRADGGRQKSAGAAFSKQIPPHSPPFFFFLLAVVRRNSPLRRRDSGRSQSASFFSLLPPSFFPFFPDLGLHVRRGDKDPAQQNLELGPSPLL